MTVGYASDNVFQISPAYTVICNNVKYVMLAGRLLIVICALLVTACTTVLSKVVSTAQIQKIGIVAAIPDKIQFSQSGITIFDNANSGVDVPDWKINQSVLDGMQAALSARYATVLRTADPDKLGWGLAMSPLDVMEGSGKAWSALSEQLGNNIEDVDLWIAVTATCAEAVNYRGPVPCGASVNRRSGIFGKQSEWLWFFAKITIFDGHTKKYLAAMDVFRSGGDCGPYGNAVNMFEAQPGCIPGADLGLDFAVDRWTDYSAAQRETIRAKLKDLIGPSLAYTLQKMNL